MLVLTNYQEDTITEMELTQKQTLEKLEEINKQVRNELIYPINNLIECIDHNVEGNFDTYYSETSEIMEIFNLAKSMQKVTDKLKSNLNLISDNNDELNIKVEESKNAIDRYESN